MPLFPVQLRGGAVERGGDVGVQVRRDRLGGQERRRRALMGEARQAGRVHGQQVFTAPGQHRAIVGGRLDPGRPCYFLVSHGRNPDLRVAGNPTAEKSRLLTALSRESSNHSAHFQLVPEGEYVRIVNRRSRLAIGLPSTAQDLIPVQSSEHLTAESGLFRMTRLSMRSGLDVQYFAAKATMDAARALLQEARTAQ